MKKFDLLKIKRPTKEEINQWKQEEYQKAKINKNNLSYWFPKIKDCSFLVPETIIVPLSFEQFDWLQSDNYKNEEIAILNNYIISYLKEYDFNTNRDLFMKTGQFSNKFNFKSCKVTNINNIGNQFLLIFYNAMLVGCPFSAEIVIREYIQPQNQRNTIYDGMPLNAEFRIFYDFDQKKILGCFNYWDTKIMQKHLYNEDLEIFNTSYKLIESEFEEYKDQVINQAEENLKNIELNGKWSVDIMKCGNNYYLIDMATAETSYYFELIK